MKAEAPIATPPKAPLTWAQQTPRSGITTSLREIQSQEAAGSSSGAATSSATRHQPSARFADETSTATSKAQPMHSITNRLNLARIATLFCCLSSHLLTNALLWKATKHPHIARPDNRLPDSSLAVKPNLTMKSQTFLQAETRLSCKRCN